jgi:molybdopterin biosynthesis enzyme
MASTDTLAPVSTDTIKDLEFISDVFNRTLGKLNHAEYLDVLTTASVPCGFEAVTIVETMIQKMFAGVTYNHCFFTYGITNYIDVEVARMRKRI